MFASATAGAFSAAGTAIVSAAVAMVAIAAVVVAFSTKVAAQKCFAFSSGKNLFRLFVKAQAGRSVTAFFINAMVTNKVAVRNFLSAFAKNSYAVGNKIVSPSAVFTFAFMFHKGKSFSKKLSLNKLYH